MPAKQRRTGTQVAEPVAVSSGDEVLVNTEAGEHHTRSFNLIGFRVQLFGFRV